MWSSESVFWGAWMLVMEVIWWFCFFECRYLVRKAVHCKLLKRSANALFWERVLCELFISLCLVCGGFQSFSSYYKARKRPSRWTKGMLYESKSYGAGTDCVRDTLSFVWIAVHHITESHVVTSFLNNDKRHIPSRLYMETFRDRSKHFGSTFLNISFCYFSIPLFAEGIHNIQEPKLSAIPFN